MREEEHSRQTWKRSHKVKTGMMQNKSSSGTLPAWKRQVQVFIRNKKETIPVLIQVLF
nr:MAG TPA: hypothetical protein [Caudoviricetes sp.]